MVQSHLTNINALPLLQYSLNCPHLAMNKVEKNGKIKAYLMKLDRERTYKISLTTSFNRKMTHYKALFSHMSQNGIIIRPSYMDTHISHHIG